jgi:hypothetical protein
MSISTGNAQPPAFVNQTAPGANDYSNTDVELNWDEFRDPEIVNQRYCLISVVGPTCAQRCSQYGLVVRGVGATQEQLDLVRKKVFEKNPHLDIYQIEVGTLIPLAFDEKDISKGGETEYGDDRAGSIMKELKSNFEKGKAEFLKHKEALKQGKRDPEDVKVGTEIQ